MNRLDELVRAVCQNGVNHIAIGQLIKQKRIITITPSIKIKRNDYLVDGATPIISQEAEYISGYCNLADKNIPKDNYVCFGDHSEHIKFIDFAFVQGADGLKIMRTDETVLSARYLFHAASSLYCRHNNYERHFKYFTDTIIPLPPLAVQQEIVRILDSFTELTAELNEKLTAELTARRKQYEHYRDELLTFGAEVPIFKLSDCVLKVSSGSNKSKSSSGKYPVYGSTGVIAYTDKYQYCEACILVARVGANAGYVHIASGKYDVSDNTLIVQPKEQVDLKYLYYVLQKMNLNTLAVGGGQPLITGGKLKELKIQIPSRKIQDKIVVFLDRFDAICNDLTVGLPAEIEARQKQYEYYRDKLLTFKELDT